MSHIDGMIVQSGGSRPHVVYIMETLAKTFPNVIWKIGGKVNRTTWAGGFSFHSVGRACDIYLDANDRLDKKLGDLLFRMFSNFAYDFKVDHTIWDGQSWSRAEGGPGAYTGGGGPHRDHVHVAFTDDHLDLLPLGFPWICDRVAAIYVLGGDGAGERFQGTYGKAFDPKRPNTRLSSKQRNKIMLKNMGFEGADD
jgi:hypothetical protein